MSPFNPIPMPIFDAIEMGGLESQKQLQISTSTLDTLEDPPPKDKEVKISPIVVTLIQADDYPDGGLAAWCIVLGVGPPQPSPSSLKFY